ncbi:hypothetical protein PAMP_003268 [Pampus punctatissimus]
MISFSLSGLFVLSLIPIGAGLQSSDNLVMFALLGDNIILPCDIPSVKSCLSTNWNMAEMFGAVSEVVKAGKVTGPNFHRHVLLKDCSLQINHLVNDDARDYTCDNGSLISNISLQILQLTENPTPGEDKIELHCFLNIYKGLGPCNDRDIRIKWTTEDNTPIYGNRFHFENPTNCFSKLIIIKKLIDHHRKWKCQLTQNDMVKATISYITTVKDGIEEVFAAVGDSVSFFCNHTSSLGMGGNVEWAMGGRPLTDDISREKGRTDAFHVNKDSSLLISEVSALHSGDYQCSLVSTGEQKVLNKIRLHTIYITSNYGPGGDNLTLTCVLTCAQACEKDSNLTWCGSSEYGMQSSLMNANNSFISTLFLPVLPVRSVACCVHREGAMMISKTWRPVNPLQTLVWLAFLPLGFLMCVAAGGLYTYTKRKHNRDRGTEQSSTEMTHVYEIIQDENNDEQLLPRQSRRQAATTTDSFYDLLQAVN